VLHQQRKELESAVQRRLDSFDAYVCPTVPLIAPPLQALDDEREYTRVNLLMLRNPTVVNLLDGCAISVPMHEEGEPPTGLMVARSAGDDAVVLRTAAWIEERL
jgi:aspartyl-tRNA(Asn)/glutamyl-tRNA(Gln) amidotransferase subunit A